ncbi:response regulator transcription factor [Tessaracoccus caeni]|uniref:response regulator transcription factor n=1 Tax=Tessaracoccus caeni TaxID=3031239 RepID=UPI0023DC0728|nr:response regulator transcription factor [Tessaracoccus caeni]MDF1487798.1 response regulator transcription factor [Tessaracoccus caeni]
MRSQVPDPGAVIRVGLCDDEPLVRRELTTVLNRSASLEVVTVKASGAAVLAYDEPVDVWLIDVNMPGGMSGIATAVSLTRRVPAPRVLLMTAAITVTEEQVEGSGASGFVFKDDRPERLIAAIHSVHFGYHLTSPEVRAHYHGAPRRHPVQPAPEFSEQQLRLIPLVMSGASYAELAEEVGVSEVTVKRYVADLMRRVDVTSRPRLMARLAEFGFH